MLFSSETSLDDSSSVAIVMELDMVLCGNSLLLLQMKPLHLTLPLLLISKWCFRVAISGWLRLEDIDGPSVVMYTPPPFDEDGPFPIDALLAEIAGDQAPAA